MPGISYASFLRVIVIVGLLYVGVQIMLATNGAMELDGVSEKLMNSNEASEQLLTLVPPELHKNLTVDPKNVTGSLEILHPHRPLSEELIYSNDTSEQVLALIPRYLHRYLAVHLTENSTERYEPMNITDMTKAMQKINEGQTIYNEDIFGPVQNDTIILAIQVHTRLTYLRHLIVSLAQARDIDKTLLIFSHDYYDEEINNLVKSIDFTKVMQIFYPYSIQTHPTEFPGTDPNDCPRDAKLEEAIKLKCNNALHPDLHGHYREAKYTQTKHHWWWKANRIFNQLQSTAGHKGMVVFLEEDHYVAEDFIYMIHLLQATRDEKCPHCEILSLGTYLKSYQSHFAADKVDITNWNSGLHNMGFAFNKTVWENIVELQEQFCDYDDYNWDYSLLHLSQNRTGRENFKVILCKEPRVFHIGECGLHHKKSNCDVSTVVNTVQKYLLESKSDMYTVVLNVNVISESTSNKKLTKGNGGWGDLRDRELCSNMTKIGRQI